MKKNLGRIVGIVLCLCMVFTLAACGTDTPAPSASSGGTESQAAPEGSGEAAAPKANEDILVGFVALTMTNPYFATQAQQVQKHCEERGWECKVYDSQMNSETELAAFEDLISQQADLIIVDNVDPEAVVAAIQQAYDAGIPVIGIDSLVDESAPVSTVVTAASKDGAIECGLWLGKKMDGAAIKAGVISGVKGNPIGKLRRDGLFAGIIEGMYEVAGTPVDKETAWKEAEEMEDQLTSAGAAKHPTLPFELVSQGWGAWSAEGGLDAMEDIITAHPDINVLLSENDDMAIGALNAITERNLNDQITIVAGADGQKEAYALIKEGKYGATSENNPVKIPQLAFEIADQILLEGKDPYSFDKVIQTEAVCVNADNVDQYYDENSPF